MYSTGTLYKKKGFNMLVVLAIRGRLKIGPCNR